MDLQKKVWKLLIIMPQILSQESLFINDFHRKSSMAALREVQVMSLHPYSREQKLAQIASLHQNAVSKENSNERRRNQNV